MKLKDLCGEHILSCVKRVKAPYESYGMIDIVDGIQFCLDGTLYQCVEDPDDGYRSYCRDLSIVDKPDDFISNIPPTKVMCHMMDNDYEDEHDVLVMRDVVNGKIIFQVGTEHVSDYYPICVMKWSPENLSCNQKEEGRNDFKFS